MHYILVLTVFFNGQMVNQDKIGPMTEKRVTL